MNLPIFDSNKIAQCLPMQACIEAMRELYESPEEAVQTFPLRSVFRVNDSSVILAMPSHSGRLRRFVVKVVTEYKENPRLYSLPVQGGMAMLLDSKNSKMLALFDSSAITAVRTGAVSGLATSFLSREDSSSVCCIGSGQQARSMLEAVTKVRNISRANVYSRNPSNSAKFAEEMKEKLGIPVNVFPDSSSAMEDADILNVATNSSSPVIRWTDIPKGAHINSIGTLPDRQELDIGTVCNAELFVDTRSGVLSDAGDVMNAIKEGRMQTTSIKGDLFSLVAGCGGRSRAEAVTLFKSVGFALQDLYACSRAYDNALTNGIL